MRVKRVESRESRIEKYRARVISEEGPCNYRQLITKKKKINGMWGYVGLFLCFAFCVLRFALGHVILMAFRTSECHTNYEISRQQDFRRLVYFRTDE